jgi:predicted DNA-binding mobile mystery protein A
MTMMKNLQIQQIDNKLRALGAFEGMFRPSVGWIKTIRTTLGMSLEQLGRRLSLPRQNVQAIEKREMDGAITIKSMQEVAKALDMELVYVFLPKDGSLDALIDRKANELATRIVTRTSHSMKLEDQENTNQRIERAIKERAAAIKNEMPRTLWD